MRVTSKGQVTIPQHVREELGITAASEVDFERQADGSYRRVKRATDRQRGSSHAGRLGPRTERERQRALGSHSYPLTISLLHEHAILQAVVVLMFLETTNARINDHV